MLEKIAARLLQPINTSVISILGMFSFLLGVWLMLPFESLAVDVLGNRTYELMVGGLMMIPGLSIIIGALKDKIGLLTFGTGVGFCFWLGFMGMTLLISWQSGWWIVALMIAFYCGFVHLNLRVNKNQFAK